MIGMINGFDNLVSGIYPPDALVSLARRKIDIYAWDRTWTYVSGINPDMIAYKYPCRCPQSGLDYATPIDIGLPPGIRITDPVVMLERHIQIQPLRVFFLGRCPYCSTIYWSSPTIKGEGK